jgi:hypothetical protein
VVLLYGVRAPAQTPEQKLGHVLNRNPRLRSFPEISNKELLPPLAVLIEQLSRWESTAVLKDLQALELSLAGEPNFLN